MKTKLLLSALLSFVFYLLSSQVPQGFNYQAIARDGSGKPIVGATIKVKLSILTDTTGFSAGGGVYFWEEEHTGVITNAYGLFNIVLGDPDATRIQGLASFNLINWSQPKLYIGTKIADPSTYKVLGSAKLWSVPYSLVAGELGGTVDKIKVKGTEVEPDSALFEVKNKNGQIVFAVYNEGVRVYVDDGVKGNTKGGFAIGGFGTDKGTSQNYLMVSRDSIRAYVNDTIVKGVTKGGFAIGGFGTEKASKQEYFRVTRDSTRIYVNDLPGKGITKGGFAIGGFDAGKTGLAPTFFDVFPDSSGKVFPAKNKILWYPLKNALLAGKVIAENRDSVGENSFASGYESRSKGKYSQALGYQAIARGQYSTSIGYQSVANFDNSFAFGQWAQAQNTESYAFGRGAIAAGYRSYAFGSAGVDSAGSLTGVAYARGNYSFAIGQGSQALGSGSFAIGIADTARAEFAISLGYKSSANNHGSHAIGYETTANGLLSTSIGSYTTANGMCSTTLGCYTTATGGYSTAMGYSTKAIGEFSTVMGYFNTANGYSSSAMGLYTNAIGSGSLAIGFSTTASGTYSFGTGNYTSSSGFLSTTFGDHTTAIDYSSIAMGYYSKANGFASLATGWNTVASGSSSVSLGRYTIAKPVSSLAIGQWNDTTCSTNGSTIWTSTDPLFIAGNGNSSLASNALTLFKNGNLTIAGTLTQSSDLRLKEDITPFTNGLDLIEKINPVYFYFIDEDTHPAGRQIGVIAQEVEEVIPELVQKDGKGILSVDYSKISVVMIQAFKEQQHQIETQQKEIDELKALVSTLIANQSGKGNK